MSTVTGYVFGYEDGRSAAEISRRNREIVGKVFYGQRTVEVDQSYLTQLQQVVEKLRADSDHNFDKADLFHREALEWKADAERHETRIAALQVQVSELQDQLDQRSAALAQAEAAVAQERAAHQTTHEQTCGLNRFRLMATWLINAHIAGRSDRPEFANLRDMAKDVTDAIERGEPFRGYRDEPDKKERLRALLKVLLRP